MTRIIFLNEKSNCVTIMSRFLLNLLKDYTWDKIQTSFSWLPDPACSGFDYLPSFTQAICVTHWLSQPHWISLKFTNTTSSCLPCDSCTHLFFFIGLLIHSLDARSGLPFSSRLKFHFLGEDFLDHPIKSRIVPSYLRPLFLSFISVNTCYNILR